MAPEYRGCPAGTHRSDAVSRVYQIKAPTPAVLVGVLWCAVHVVVLSLWKVPTLRLLDSLSPVDTLTALSLNKVVLIQGTVFQPSVDIPCLS